MNRVMGVLSIAVVVACAWCAAARGNVVISRVMIGDPGNAADPRYPNGGVPSFGAVDYIYSIGKYEVTAGQYTQFLNRVGGVDTYGLYNPDMSDTSYGNGITRSGGGTIGNPYTYSVALLFVNRPVGSVSFWDSCRFVNWLQNGQPAGAQGPGTTETGVYTLNGYTGTDGRTIQRNAGWTWALPNEDEWYKAAYYKGGSTNAGYWDYPTSSNAQPGRDMADVSGNNANYHGNSGPFPIDPPRYYTVVGEFQNSDSPYGTFDQGGNVSEWSETIYDDTLRRHRGGSAGDDAPAQLHAQGWAQTTPSVEYCGIGFRVVQIPEPATLGLLALGGIAIFQRRRHR